SQSLHRPRLLHTGGGRPGGHVPRGPGRAAGRSAIELAQTDIVKPLFTIGYEQSTATAFFDALTQAKVGLLVDVRAVAASRRPGSMRTASATGICKSPALRGRDGLRRAAGRRTRSCAFPSAILHPRRRSTSLMN